MTPAQELTKGTIPSIIRNDANVYEGDLRYYLRVILERARNLRYPYHNFRHMLHVTWLCYCACVFYSINNPTCATPLSRRGKRILLIGAMFHDFDHSGLMGDDDINIMRAIRALERHALPEDRPYLDEIRLIIQATEYPYKIASGKLNLQQQIIRDADLSQALSIAWVQQVIFGLASEWGKTPLEVLKMQGPFMKGLKFHTEWAKGMFPQNVIDEKIKEAQEFLDILDGPDTTPQVVAKAA